MPFFLAPANQNEAIVVESLGRPVSAALSWKFVFFPCVSVAKRFQVDKYNIRFQTDKVQTKDGKRLTLNMEAKFKVDTQSEADILKAYKKFLDDAGSTRDEDEGEVLNLRSAVKNIITEVAMRQILKMTLDEAVRFQWLLIDNILNETSYILEEHSILLHILKLKNISDCLEEKLVEEDIYFNINEEAPRMEEANKEDSYDLDNQVVDECQPLIGTAAMETQKEESSKNAKVNDVITDKTLANFENYKTPLINSNGENDNSEYQKAVGIYVTADLGEDAIEIINIDTNSDETLQKSENKNALLPENTTEASEKYKAGVDSSNKIVKVTESEENSEYVIID